MRASLFSPLWYRVASQHPCLRRNVRVSRQRFRDETWYVLVSDISHKHYRVTDRAYEVIGRCDGTNTVGRIWDTLLEEMGDDAPTQDEVISILSQLDDQGLLGYEGVTDAGTLVKPKEERIERRRRALLNPLAFQVELGNPTALLRALEPLGRVLFTRTTFCLWVTGILLAVAGATLNAGTLISEVRDHMSTSRFLLLAWLTFPFIKGLHELAHGLAVRHWGGEVPAAGITLFVLTPAPYVDASAAAAFRSRRQRMVVSAAGIMTELSLAALALFVWLNVQPGLVRDLSLVTALTASLSTLLFNGNPLLRFDAYYLLCDAFDLPNLATRSRTWWSEHIWRWTFGVTLPVTTAPAPGERPWLIAYGPLSFVYRVFACVLIVLWAGAFSVALGTAAFLYIAVMIVGKPLVSALRSLWSEVPTVALWRARAIVGGTFVGVATLLCVVPLPFHTAAEGIVSPPDQSHVRPGVGGFIAEAPARDGQRVEAGEVILVLDDPQLTAARRALAAELERVRTGLTSALRESSRSGDYEGEIVRMQSELTRMDEKLAQLEVRAQTSGILALPRQDDLAGAFVKQGTTVGYVLNGDTVRVRAAVPERDAALVRGRVDTAEVRLAERAGTTRRAVLIGEVPAASRELPSAALTEVGGGSFPADPDDKRGLRTAEPVVLVDLELPGTSLERIGGRAYVRFDHGAEPLAIQWLRRGRQLFLQHFNPTG